MSLESFFGLDDADSQGSAEASEKFREQMRKNAKAIKAITAHQKKQKKQEDKLAKILVRYIQDPASAGVVFLIVKLLQDNIPGAFILAILSLNEPQIREEIREALNSGQKKLESKDSDEKVQTGAIINFGKDGVLPNEVKAELNTWGEFVLEAGMLLPGKTLSTVLTPEQKLKSIVLDVIDYTLKLYFQRKGLEIGQDKVRQFALLSIQSVLIRLRDVALTMNDAEIIESTPS